MASALLRNESRGMEFIYATPHQQLAQQGFVSGLGEPQKVLPNECCSSAAGVLRPGVVHRNPAITAERSTHGLAAYHPEV